MIKHRTAQEEEAELNDVISKCQHPEFYVGMMLNKEIYFNPIYHCAMLVDYNNNVAGHTWFTSDEKFFNFINEVFDRIIKASPTYLYQKIRDLYNEYNVVISDDTEKYLSCL